MWITRREQWKRRRKGRTWAMLLAQSLKVASCRLLVLKIRAHALFPNSR